MSLSQHPTGEQVWDWGGAGRGAQPPTQVGEGGPAHWWKGDPGRGGNTRRGAEALGSGGPGEGRLRQGEEPLPASCGRGSLPLRLRYKTRGGMTAAPAATFSVRDPRLGSRAGCGCCWLSWSSPPPRPGLAQVNEGFGPGTPRWPLSGPSRSGPRPGCARPRCGGACGRAGQAPGSQRSEGAAAGLGARGSGPAVLLQASCGLWATMQARPRGAAQGSIFSRSPPPPLTLSGVSRPCSCASVCPGSLSVPRGLSAW